MSTGAVEGTSNTYKSMWIDLTTTELSPFLAEVAATTLLVVPARIRSLAALPLIVRSLSE